MLPTLGQCSIGEVRRPDLLAVLARIARLGALRAQVVTDALAHALHVIAKARVVELVAIGVVTGEAGAGFGLAFDWSSLRSSPIICVASGVMPEG